MSEWKKIKISDVLTESKIESCSPCASSREHVSSSSDAKGIPSEWGESFRLEDSFPKESFGSEGILWIGIT